jgi:hypothetical protein
VIEVELLIASEDEAAIETALASLDWAHLPGMFDLGMDDRPFNDPELKRTVDMVVDEKKAGIGDRRVYVDALAAELSRELGVRVVTDADYDSGAYAKAHA